MKKYLLLTLAALLAAALPFAAGALDAPEDNLLKPDPRTRGLAVDALSLEDGGLLLLGESAYGEDAWMARTGKDGSVLWTLREEGGGVFRNAREMPGGDFTALIKREADPETGTGEYSALLATVSGEGKLLRTRKLSAQTRWLVPLKDGWFAMGTYYPRKNDVSGAQVTVARLDMKGERKWSTRLPSGDREGMIFNRAVMSGDALFATAEGILADGSRVALLLRLDQRGNLRATQEIRLGEDSYADGLAASPGGGVVLTAEGWTYEEDGPGTRLGAILGYSAKSELMWQHLLYDQRSADYLLSLPQGILVGSRGLNLEGSPLLGGGWLMLMDHDGLALPASLPDIGGWLELTGLSMDKDGTPLLLGAVISWPQTVDAAYAARLELSGIIGN